MIELFAFGGGRSVAESIPDYDFDSFRWQSESVRNAWGISLCCMVIASPTLWVMKKYVIVSKNRIQLVGAKRYVFSTATATSHWDSAS